jgi:hypothetical protein
MPMTDKLLAFGGGKIGSQPNPWIPVLLSLGELMDYSVKLRRMEPNRCYENVERLGSAPISLSVF